MKSQWMDSTMLTITISLPTGLRICQSATLIMKTFTMFYSLTSWKHTKKRTGMPTQATTSSTKRTWKAQAPNKSKTVNTLTKTIWIKYKTKS